MGYVTANSIRRQQTAQDLLLPLVDFRDCNMTEQMPCQFQLS